MMNKLLVSLRVTLSTAKLAFLHDFVRLAGLDGLSDCLYRLTLTVPEAGGIGEQNVVEIVKSLRVLMNTDVRKVYYIAQALTTDRIHRCPRSAKPALSHSLGVPYTYSSAAVSICRFTIGALCAVTLRRSRLGLVCIVRET